jgi:hypothetical protein
MRRWDGLVDAYLEEYVARGVSTAMVDNVRRELERWGNWMKRRRLTVRPDASHRRCGSTCVAPGRSSEQPLLSC